MPNPHSARGERPRRGSAKAAGFTQPPPPGSGKSTLVRALSTLLLYERGSARVFGHDVQREPRAVRRLVNRVSVEASFFKRLSAAANLAYAARFYGIAPRETRRRVPAILAAVAFPAVRSRAPMEDLSRGMQQKVALAARC